MPGRAEAAQHRHKHPPSGQTIQTAGIPRQPEEPGGRGSPYTFRAVLRCCHPSVFPQRCCICQIPTASLLPGRVSPRRRCVCTGLQMMRHHTRILTKINKKNRRLHSDSMCCDSNAMCHVTCSSSRPASLVLNTRGQPPHRLLCRRHGFLCWSGCRKERFSTAAASIKIKDYSLTVR